MKGVRYEIGDVGIFHAQELLEACDMERSDAEDYEWAAREFEEFLPIPELLSNREVKDINTCSYFTEAGVERFREALEIFEDLFSRYIDETGLGELNVIENEIDDENILYSDDYQLIAYSEKALDKYYEKEF